MMPQLKLEDVIKILNKMKERKYLEEATDILYTEQTDDFVVQLLVAALDNPDSVRGFIVCYLAIREKLMAKGIDELERLYKLK